MWVIQAEKTVFYLALVTSSKFIGAGLATIGLSGAGVGIGVLFGGYWVQYLVALFL